MSDAQAKVDDESAQADYERFMESMDLDPNPVHKDEGDLQSFEDSKYEFINALKDGRLEVDANGELDFRPQITNMTNPIHFAEPTGKVLRSMDRLKEGHGVGKGIAVLAEMTKRPAVEFDNMRQRDLRVCQAVVALFLASRSRPR